MAQRVVTSLEDDIDGGEASETITFGLDGTSYEIDLNDANAARLRDALAEFIRAGRKIGRTGGRRAPAQARGASAREIRGWAKANGYEVPDRGRIPAVVREAFDATR